MRRLFLSDLHLQDPQEPAFRRFTECLAFEGPRVDEIYLLGDVVEMWVGDDDRSDCATALQVALREASRHCQVSLIHGNRDFLMGEAFAEAAGITLLSDPHVTADGMVLSHGDALCTDDSAYQTLRTTLRSEAWQADILAKSLAERHALGVAMREQSRTTIANKSTNIMDVNAAAVAELMAQQRSQLLVHGHTHRPGIHLSEWGRRYVLGAWESCGWCLAQHDDRLALYSFSLAHRYESGIADPDS